MKRTDIIYPLPPFTMASALEKVNAMEEVWNSNDPLAVSKLSTIDSEWRSNTHFLNGHEEIIRFLTTKWKIERHYKLKKELWGFRGSRMAVRFEHEFQDEKEQWFRGYGIELLEFNINGLIHKRFANINIMKIENGARKLR